MSRSVWKGNYINKIYISKKKSFLLKNSSVISKSLVGLRILYYNGKNFSFIFIKRSFIGLKIGEYCFTRKK